MATAIAANELVDVIASEIALGVGRAVEFWMLQIDDAMSDPHLTSLGRLYAVRDIVQNYKIASGKGLMTGGSAGDADEC